jgi:hypothetical protein
MASPQKILQDAYNSLQPFARQLENLGLTLVYGKGLQPVNFAANERSSEIVVAVKNIRENPSLQNIQSTLQVINTYDVCNPLQFAVGQLFPPGSEVANIFNGVQGQISEIVNAFRGFNIAEGTNEVSAIAVPDPLGEEEFGTLPFKLGKIELEVGFQGTNRRGREEGIIPNGSYVTITQTEDPKVTSVMRGQVDNSFDTDLGKSYIINIESISPSIPPYEKTKNGDVVTDEFGEPVEAQYSTFKIEYTNILSSNVQDLSKDLIEVTNALQSIGITEVAAQLNNLPSSLPGIGSLQGLFKDVIGIVEEIGIAGAQAAGFTGTTGQALAGNLSAEDVIDRVRVLRDFYNKILPYTNITFAIQEIFKKQIESVNNVLRNVIPYDQIAAVIKVVVFLSRIVLSIINTIITFLSFINNIIKTITSILKVIKIILKVIRAVIKILPALFVPVGAIEVVTTFLKKIEEAIQTGIDLLQNISRSIDSIIGVLSFVKYYLQLVIAESVRFAAKLESCKGITTPGFSASANEAARNNFIALKNLLDAIPNLDKFKQPDGYPLPPNEGGPTTFVVVDGQGTIMPLRDSVFGFDENGNILFYGDLTSTATGVNFENTLGQDFRGKLQYYTFNKFKNSNRPLIEAAENVFTTNQERIADPEDRFGNFQELYLGYTIKIQEDRPTDQNENNLLRRRGIALDSSDKIVATTDLTFSNNLEQIVTEVKYKLKLYVDQGIIGINTLDKSSNQISDSDALGLAEDIGVNPIGANNVKAEANNRAASNINPKFDNSIEGTSISNTQPTETRIGNDPFTPIDETPTASSISGKGSSSKIINVDSLVSPLIERQKQQNPEFKAIQDVFNTLSSLSPGKVGEILNKPGSENMSDDELLTTLKESVLNTLDPNPDKVEDLQRKTAIWYEGLRKKTRIDWEQLTINFRKPKDPIPPFEDYYDQIEEQELPKWIKLLTRQRYTETEIQMGVDDVRIRDKYQIKFGPDSSVKVILRPAFKKRN